MAVAAVLVLGAGGAGIAYATGDDPAGQNTGGDSGEQATGPNIEKAKSVALDHTNGGRVTGTELNDEEGYYEIEVTRDSGQVDVHLDKNFNLLVTKADHEGANDQDGPNDQGEANDN
ncbi:MAG: hypothetical protein H0T91_05330 [Propionibacteriaceae bacterium]|nr:hypothetical protein [Propionibacteriaceae bacterium]